MIVESTPPPSSQPFNSAQLGAYRTAMTRVSLSDLDTFCRRVEVAHELGTTAFLGRDRSAWMLVQMIEYRLQRRAHLRPTDPGDVAVLDTLYRIEESTLPELELPRGLTPREFCNKLTADMEAASSPPSPGVRLFATADLEDWRYLGRHILISSDDFARMVAISSLPLPPAQARIMYLNLFDEAGRDDERRMHILLLERFLRGLDVDLDRERALEWIAPEFLAMVNAQYRLLWHPEPCWSLGSMYLYEKLLPPQLKSARDRLATLGVSRELLAWFDEHIVVDEMHSDGWLAAIEAQLVSYEDQRIAYTAALQRCGWLRRARDAQFEGWKVWKATGEPPHLPFHALRASTGC